MTRARKNQSNKKDFRYHCSCEGFSTKKKKKFVEKTGGELYGTHFQTVNSTSVARKFPKESHDDDDNDDNRGERKIRR